MHEGSPPLCPGCGRAMSVAEVLSTAGLRGKPVRWRCAEDDIEASAAHPVQIAHLHVGDQEVRGGRTGRIVKLEMKGAELVVFSQLVRG
ncbi:MAG TPA: hypothetical protein VFD01_03120 [Candidatus Dormibacteraeota bacterium]|jgi:hypothetical protein|nr:hypothetical protein [Candidatus Dormibacteraeota bacterium]